MKKINRVGRVLRHEYLRVFAAGCIILFAILPLGTLAFHVSGEDLAYLAGNKSFRQSVGNSLIYASVSALITTGLALIAAYLLNTLLIGHYVDNRVCCMRIKLSAMCILMTNPCNCSR